MSLKTRWKNRRGHTNISHSILLVLFFRFRHLYDEYFPTVLYVYSIFYLLIFFLANWNSSEKIFRVFLFNIFKNGYQIRVICLSLKDTIAYLKSSSSPGVYGTRKIITIRKSVQDFHTIFNVSGLHTFL